MALRTERTQLIVEINAKESADYQKILKTNKGIIRDFRKMEAGSEGFQKALKDQIELSKKAAKTDFSKLSLRQLTDRRNQLKALQRVIPQVTFAEAGFAKELKSVNTELSRSYQATRPVISQFSKLKSLIPGLGIGAALAGIVRSGFQSIRTFIGIDDSLADLRKTTGLAKDEARELKKELEGLNTRTTTEGLIQIATAAGRLGIAKDDLFEFTKTADKVFVALGDDLEGTAEDIATTLGKISAVFGVEETFGTAEGINKIGSAINALSAGTKAAAGPIVDGTKRLAGLASTADIGAADILGLTATLDELGLRTEASTSAVQKMIVKIAESPDEFADLAESIGVTRDEFKTMFESDPNAAFLTVLEAAGSTDEGLQGLNTTLGRLGITGVREIQTITALAGSVDTLRKNQALANDEFEKGTSLQDEFNIKNETAAASVEKMSNAFNQLSAAIGQRLEGTIRNVTRAAARLFDRMKEGIDPTETLSEKIRDQQKAANIQVGTIRRLTIRLNELKDSGEDQNAIATARNRLIDEANQKYGDYLPNLLSEKSTVEDITKAQKEMNDAFREHILLIAFEETIAGLQEEIKVFEIQAAQTAAQAEKLRERAFIDEDLPPLYADMARDQADFWDVMSKSSIEGTAKVEDEIDLFTKVFEDRAAAIGTTLENLQEKFGRGLTDPGDGGSGGGGSAGGLGDDLDEATAKVKKLESALDQLLNLAVGDALAESLSLDDVGRPGGLDDDTEASFFEERAFERFIAGETAKDEFLIELEDARLDREIANLEYLLSLDTLTTDEKILNAERLATLRQQKADDAIALNEYELESLRQKHEVELGLAEDMFATIGDFVIDFNQDSERAFKNLQRGILSTLLKAIENSILLSIAEAQARSLASKESIATFGVAGLVKGAIITGLIKGAFGAIRSQLNSYYTGGVVSGQRLDGPANVPRQAGGDNMLILAKKGEVVLNESQQAAIGGPAIFRRAGVPGFASGGALTTANTTPAPAENLQFGPAGGSDQDAVLERLDVLTDVVASQARTIRAFVVLDDITDAEAEINSIKSKADL